MDGYNNLKYQKYVAPFGFDVKSYSQVYLI